MTSKRTKLGTTTALVFGALIFLTGCSAETEIAETAPAPEVLDEFQSEAAQDFELTVNGQTYNLASLNALEPRTVQIFEPFTKEDTEFNAVSLGDLLIEAGFDPSDQVQTVALNDYIYVDSVKSFQETGALLAFLENGSPIAVSDGGPVRIIFDEDSSYYDFPDAWNWSLSDIEKVSG